MGLEEYSFLVYEHNKANYTGPEVLEGKAAVSALKGIFGSGSRGTKGKPGTGR